MKKTAVVLLILGLSVPVLASAQTVVPKCTPGVGTDGCGTGYTCDPGGAGGCIPNSVFTGNQPFSYTARDAGCMAPVDCAQFGSAYTCDTSIDTCVPTVDVSNASTAGSPTLCAIGGSTSGCVLNCNDPRAASCGTGYSCNTSTGYCETTAGSAGGQCPNGTYANGVCVGNAQSGLPAGTTASGNILNSNTQTGSTQTSGTKTIAINTALLNSYRDAIVNTINRVVAPVLLAIAFIAFLYGVAKAYIINGANETERGKGHQLILWAIIGFVVIFGLWGLVNLLGSLLGLTAGGAAPGYPTL